MKYKLTIYHLTTFIISLLIFNSCSVLEPRMKGEIEAKEFVDTYDITEGECCIISWDIKNADIIVFQTKKYAGKDSVRVCPDDTTTYTISTANADQTKFFKVKVNVNPYVQKIRTGSEYVSKSIDTISIELSDYFVGVVPVHYNSRINKIRITRIFEQNNGLLVNFIPLDLFGNFIEGLDFGSHNLSFQFIKDNTRIPCKISSVDRINNTGRNHFYFVIESSFNAQFIESIINQLRRALLTFSSSDLVTVYFVNHKVNKIIEGAIPSYASLLLSSTNIAPKGLNSTANGLFEVLTTINQSTDKASIKPVVILCNFSGENSSITYTLSDVVKVARKEKVPIYTIGIGLDAKTYQLTPLANSTNAKDYILTHNEIDVMQKIFNEIYFSQKRGYRASIQPLGEIDKYESLNLHISTHNGENFVEDKFNFYNKLPEIYTPFQILSLFDHLGSGLLSEYSAKVDELSELLKDNPNAQVELIGHSNFETLDDTDDSKLALDRASSIARKLIENGVNEKQIITKTKGNLNPLYYFPKVEWQVAINRRVEIRWLDPSLLPFEIIAQTAVSETEANKYVDEWEKLGYRSYYQRVVTRNQEVVYRVKIWGFATKSEVENAIRVLSFKYPNNSFALE